MVWLHEETFSWKYILNEIQGVNLVVDLAQIQCNFLLLSTKRTFHLNYGIGTKADTICSPFTYYNIGVISYCGRPIWESFIQLYVGKSPRAHLI